MSILSRRLGNPVSPLDSIILAKLVDVALVAPENVFEEIIHMFAHINKQRSSSKNSAITSAVRGLTNSVILYAYYYYY